MIRVGVDAGGTFTDFVAVGPGWYRELKLPSRPDDPAAVVMDALARLGLVDQAIELVFSTTAATNALLQRRGGPTVLVTTNGFEDVLEIGRQTRPLLYALEPEKPVPLVPAADRLGIEERVLADGTILHTLEEAELARILVELAARPGATVAVCLLHAYAQPVHERRLAERLRARGIEVSVSSEVCPLPREYERTSTTVIDAYVAPVLGTTLSALRGRGISLRVMESSGGARADGGVRPARTVLSGPAAGVIATEVLARRRGLPRVIALDIGGTSTDVALVVDGKAARVDELAIDGLPIALPSVAVRTVGAGGGSIAWIDGGGALRVGPRSAGALPGPAAYAHGGTEPTVTDSQLVLGRLGARLCGGAIVLDLERARAAVAGIAATLRVSIEEAAHAIVAVADASITRAVRTSSLGVSPATLAMVAYGGASGLHAVSVARALGIPQVLVPAAPGLQCALGALGAEVVVDELAAWGRPQDPGVAAQSALRRAMDALAARADAALAADGISRERRSIGRTVRARYEGQGLDAELELPVDEAHSRAAFDRAHELAYGHRLDRAVELVSLRVRGVGCTTAVVAAPAREIGWARVGSRELVGSRAPIYARARLRPGQRVVGPAVVEELSATLWLPDGASAEVQDDGVVVVASGVRARAAQLGLQNPPPARR